MTRRQLERLVVAGVRKEFSDALGIDMSDWRADVGGGGDEVTWWVTLTSPKGPELHANDIYVNDDTGDLMQWSPAIRL